MEIEGGEREGGFLPGFAQKEASSDGRVYAVDEAEGRDLRYLIENSCMTCNKMLPRHAVRVLPTRYMQEKDPYVRNGVVEKRYMCVSCFNSMRSMLRMRIWSPRTAGRSQFVSEMVQAYLAKH